MRFPGILGGKSSCTGMRSTSARYSIVLSSNVSLSAAMCDTRAGAGKLTRAMQPLFPVAVQRVPPLSAGKFVFVPGCLPHEVGFEGL